MKKEKIAIIGGTFNPVHNGHLHLANVALEELEIDRIVIIPSNVPPHKCIEGDVTTQDRVAMTTLAFADIQNCSVSDVEFHRAGKSYTVDTLKQLKSKNPEAELYLILGSDMFLSVDKWYRARDIFSLCTIVAVSRYKDEYNNLLDYSRFLQSNFGAHTKVLSIEPLEISSTEIRKKIASGEDVSELIPPKVYEYIKKRGIYH